MGTNHTVSTTKTSIRILERLKERNGARVTELADELEISPSTVHNHLMTLKEEGYVVKQGDLYDLSMKFIQLGQYVQDRDRVFQIIKPRVEALMNESEERANFVIEENSQGVYVVTEKGEHSVDTFAQKGRQLFLHASSAGKAILAELPREKIEEIIEHQGLPEMTQKTITDRGELYEQLDRVRERGFAICDEEYISGVRAVSTSVCKPSGEVIGALGISGAAYRLTDEKIHEEFSDPLLGIANEIELEIEHKLS